MSTQKILTLLLNTGKHLILADFSKVYLQSPDTAFDNDDNTQVKTLFNVVIYIEYSARSDLVKKWAQKMVGIVNPTFFLNCHKLQGIYWWILWYTMYLSHRSSCRTEPPHSSGHPMWKKFAKPALGIRMQLDPIYSDGPASESLQIRGSRRHRDTVYNQCSSLDWDQYPQNNANLKTTYCIRKRGNACVGNVLACDLARSKWGIYCAPDSCPILFFSAKKAYISAFRETDLKLL